MADTDTDGAAPTLIVVPGGNPDPTAEAREAAALGRPIRTRWSPTVLIGSEYRGVSGLRWILDLPDEAAFTAFYADMDAWVRQWVAARAQATTQS